jgi:hypothetical protein
MAEVLHIFDASLAYFQALFVQSLARSIDIALWGLTSIVVAELSFDALEGGSTLAGLDVT